MSRLIPALFKNILSALEKIVYIGYIFFLVLTKYSSYRTFYYKVLRNEGAWGIPFGIFLRAYWLGGCCG